MYPDFWTINSSDGSVIVYKNTMAMPCLQPSMYLWESSLEDAVIIAVKKKSLHNRGNNHFQVRSLYMSLKTKICLGTPKIALRISLDLNRSSMTFPKSI